MVGVAGYTFCRAPFALGDDPSLADCATMGPLYGHRYRVPRSGVIVRHRAPRLCAWIKRMRAREPSPEPEPATPDTLPDTLLAVLRHQ